MMMKIKKEMRKKMKENKRKLSVDGLLLNTIDLPDLMVSILTKTITRL
jgi:hypothetical protein